MGGVWVGLPSAFTPQQTAVPSARIAHGVPVEPRVRNVPAAGSPYLPPLLPQQWIVPSDSSAQKV